MNTDTPLVDLCLERAESSINAKMEFYIEGVERCQRHTHFSWHYLWFEMHQKPDESERNINKNVANDEEKQAVHYFCSLPLMSASISLSKRVRRNVNCI